MTEEEAIKIARTHAQEKGWPWLEPIECRWHSRWLRNPVYVVRSNVEGRGANVVISVNELTGAIEDSRFLRR